MHTQMKKKRKQEWHREDSIKQIVFQSTCTKYKKRNSHPKSNRPEYYDTLSLALRRLQLRMNED